MLSRIIAFVILLLALKILLPHAFDSFEHVLAKFFQAVGDPNVFRVDNVANSAYQMNTAGYFPQTADIRNIEECGRVHTC